MYIIFVLSLALTHKWLRNACYAFGVAGFQHGCEITRPIGLTPWNTYTFQKQWRNTLLFTRLADNHSPTRQMRAEFRIGERKYKPNCQSGEDFFPLAYPCTLSIFLASSFLTWARENTELLASLASVLKNLFTPLFSCSFVYQRYCQNNAQLECQNCTHAHCRLWHWF
jgi:hypothetical protein